MADRDPQNHLRVELYRRLRPLIQQLDQSSGAHGYVLHWDDEDTAWDEGSIDILWDKIGLSPVIQELFWSLEKSSGEDLQVLEDMDAITDPLRCPEELLPDLAASLGYRLAESLTEEQKRLAILGLVDAFKARGNAISFRVFFRMLGFDLLKITPLWKKDIQEANGDYSQVRWETVTIAGSPVGPSGTSSFAGRLADAPIRPGSLRFFAGGDVVVRDDGEGHLLGQTTESGTINYTTGDYRLDLAAPAADPVTATLDKITEEWPYHAARIDIELSIDPLGDPIPLIDEAVVQSILTRLEEVRPIHVIVRTLALVVEIADNFGPEGATDRVACVTLVKDDRDGVPSVPSTGSKRRFIMDQGPKGDDALKVEEITGGITTALTMTFDDEARGICPNDVLVIHRDDGSPDYFA